MYQKEMSCLFNLNDLFQINAGSSSRRVNMLTQPKYNSMSGSNSLRFQGAKLWNEIDKLRLQVIMIHAIKNALALSVKYAYSKFFDSLW